MPNDFSNSYPAGGGGEDILAAAIKTRPDPAPMSSVRLTAWTKQTMCIYIYIYTYIHMYVYTYIYIYLYLCMHILYTYTYTYIYVCMYVCMCMYIYIYIHTCIHIHIKRCQGRAKSPPAGWGELIVRILVIEVMIGLFRKGTNGVIIELIVRILVIVVMIGLFRKYTLYQAGRSRLQLD